MANFTRQLDIINPQKLLFPITIIGLGGGGSSIAFTTRKMGFKNFTLWDHDTVESENIPCQNYEPRDMGRFKTEATRDRINTCLDNNASITIRTEKFTRTGELLEGIVVAAVDTIEARKIIWEAVKQSSTFVPLYLDGRAGIIWDNDRAEVAGELIEIFAINPMIEEDCALYEQHFFEKTGNEENNRGRCTAQQVIYIGNFVSGLMASHLRKWACGKAYPRYYLFDVLTLKMLHVIF